MTPKPGRSCRQAESGFTYIEVLIAATLSLVGIFGVMASFPQASSTTVNAARTTVMNHLAALTLDDLRTKGVGHSDLAAGIQPDMVTLPGGLRHYPVSGFDKEYSVRWTVTDDVPETGMKQVVIMVTYEVWFSALEIPARTSKSRQVVVRTYLR